MKRIIAVIGALALVACSSTGAAQTAGTQASIEQQTRSMSRDPAVLMTRIGVTDIDRSARFYSDVFGMTVSPYGPHERSLSYPSGGAGILFFHAPNAAPQAAGSTNGLIMRVADADEVVRRATAAGGQVRGQVRDIPQMNMRMVGIIDPDGTFIEVVQSTNP